MEYEFKLIYVTPVHYHMIIIVSSLVYNTLLSTTRNLTPTIYLLYFNCSVQCAQLPELLILIRNDFIK